MNRRNLGVWDEAFKKENVAAEAVEKHRMEVDAWLDQKTADCCWVENKEISVANSERQMGTPVHTNKLILELNKLIPNIKFYPSKFTDPRTGKVRDTMQVCQVRNYGIGSFEPATGVWATGVKQAVVGYIEPVIMPEYSIMSVKEERIATKERNPQHGAMQTRKVPWNEDARGWRSFLAMLVKSELLTPTQADRLVTKFGGTADRLSWQQKLGKTQEATAF